VRLPEATIWRLYTSELMTRFICGRKMHGPGLIDLFIPVVVVRWGNDDLPRDVSDSVEHFLVAHNGCFRLSNVSWALKPVSRQCWRVVGASAAASMRLV